MEVLREFRRAGDLGASACGMNVWELRKAGG